MGPVGRTPPDGASLAQHAWAAVKGAGFAGCKAFARVLIASVIIVGGAWGLALARWIGVFESADAYGEAREHQEFARTPEVLKPATFDSVFADLSVCDSLSATSTGIRGAALLARGAEMPQFRGRARRNLQEELTV